MKKLFLFLLINAACLLSYSKDVAFDLYFKTCMHHKAGTINYLKIALMDDSGRWCTAHKINEKKIDFNLLHLFDVKCKPNEYFHIEKLKMLEMGQDWEFGDVSNMFCVTMVKIVPREGILKGVEIKTISPMKKWVGFSWTKIPSDLDINNCAPNPCKNSIACQAIALPSVKSNSQNVYTCFCAHGWQGKYCDEAPFCDCDYQNGGCTISKAAPRGYVCQCIELEGTCAGLAKKCKWTWSCPVDCDDHRCCLKTSDCDGN